MTWFDQSDYDLRCEWGERGASALAPHVDAIIIVDVLSFSTCVDIATMRSAEVYPYEWKDASAEAFAREIGGLVASSREDAGYSLSAASLLAIPSGTKLVLPSPNGSTLSRATGNTPTFTACLRNAGAVARAAQMLGSHIGVVPAGERWPDGSLRPSLEDWLGAGAVLRHLDGIRSPEADAARRTYEQQAGKITAVLRGCASGRELIERGFERDVTLAAEAHVSSSVPRLVNGAYRNDSSSPIKQP